MSAVPPGLSSSYKAYLAQYDLAFQISPIILQGGIATGVQGGLLPITTLTGGSTNDLDQAFARYLPLPGSTLISNAVGMYPFANQAVAANAIIVQPLTISLVMIAPVNQPGGYLSKFHAFSALQSSLAQHNSSGGMYIVATPAFMYNNLIMTAMTDITESEGKQQQIEWQLDFIQPILTLAGAQAALNSLMNRVAGGGSFTAPPAWSGNQNASAANLPGVIGALATFGASLPSTGTGTSSAVGILA